MQHLGGHADGGAIEEDVVVAPGGQPGGLVGLAGAQAAQCLQGGHHAVDEGCYQRATPIWFGQRLSKLLSKQYIALRST